MQKITDVQMFNALTVLTGIVDMVDMSGNDPETFEQIGIDIVKAVVLDAYVIIRDYDGSNDKMIEGKTMFLEQIESISKLVYPNLREDLEKRA